MSRLTADQESRGVDADCGVGAKGSVMRVNLTEGCGPVNRVARRVKRETCETSATRADGTFRVSLLPQVSRVSLG